MSLPPDHLIHNPRIALDDLHHFGAHVLVHIVGHGDAVVGVLVKSLIVHISLIIRPTNNLFVKIIV